MIEKEEKQGIQWLNKQLPENVCVQVYGMPLFKLMIEKLNDLWTGVVLPKNIKEDSPIPWCITYLKYNVNNETRYLIWFFDNCFYPESMSVSYEQILEQINEFLREENNEG